VTRHEDFCRDDKCATCNPKEAIRDWDRQRDDAIYAARNLTDRQLEYVLSVRKDNILKVQLERLTAQHERKLLEASELAVEIGKIRDRLGYYDECMEK
jgi:ADP-glucose pyrophosphorylase